MSAKDKPVLQKRPSKQEVPVYVTLENRFSIQDLRKKNPKLVNAVLEFYYPKLDKQIPEWLKDTAIAEDAAGLASDVLLKVIERCDTYGSFKELDDDITALFEKSKNKASSHANSKKNYTGKEESLDAVIWEGVDDTTYHDRVADKNAKDALDILIDDLDGISELDDLQKAEQENQKNSAAEAASRVLSASQLNIYDLHYNRHMPAAAIAARLRKSEASVKHSLAFIAAEIHSSLFPNAPSKPPLATHSLNQNDPDYHLALRAYRMGLPLEHIQKRLGISSHAIAQYVAKSGDKMSYHTGREEARNRRIYEAYSNGISISKIIQQFDLNDAASLNKIISHPSVRNELAARRVIDRTKPTPLDILAEERARTNANGVPVTEEMIAFSKRELISASWSLTTERRKNFFLYFQEGLSSSQTSDIQRRSKEIGLRYLSTTRTLLLNHAERQKNAKPVEYITPLEALLRENEDAAIDVNENQKTRQENKQKIIAYTKYFFSPQKQKIFSGYFLDGRLKSEIRKSLVMSDDVLRNHISDIKRILRQGLAQGFPEKITPLDVLVREGEDTRNPENARLKQRQQKKDKILSNVGHILHPNRYKLFSLYFEQGRDKEEVISMLGLTRPSFNNGASEVKEILKKGLTDGFPKKLTPLEELVRDGEDTDLPQADLDALREEKKRKIATAVKRLLSPEKQKVFSLFFEKNTDRQEIAEKLNMPPSTVNTHITRIRDKLKEDLNENALNPLEALIRENEDLQKSKTELEASREDKKEKILANAEKVLNPEKQKIFSYFFQQGYKTPQISKLLKIPTDTINKKIYEIKSTLRDGLSKNFTKKLTPLEAMVRENEETSLSPDALNTARDQKTKTIMKVAQNILSDRRKKVFSLYFVNGISSSDIAASMKIGKNFIKADMQFIRENLKLELDKIAEKKALSKEKTLEKNKKEYHIKSTGLSQKAIASEAIIHRAYRLGIPFSKIMSRYEISNYGQFYSIISKSKSGEAASTGRFENETRRDNALSERICADYADNMLMDDLVEKYKTTHTTILSMVRKTGKADELLKQRRFTYEALCNDRQREVAAFLTYQSAPQTAKSMSTHGSYVYRDKDAIKDKLAYLQKIPNMKSNNLPDRPYTLIGRSIGMFTFDKELNQKYTNLVMKAKDEGHLDDVYSGMVRTLENIEQNPSPTQGQTEARAVFKKAALDIIVRCGEPSLDDVNYKKITAYISK